MYLLIENLILNSSFFMIISNIFAVRIENVDLEYILTSSFLFVMVCVLRFEVEEGVRGGGSLTTSGSYTLSSGSGANVMSGR